VSGRSNGSRSDIEQKDRSGFRGTGIAPAIANNRRLQTAMRSSRVPAVKTLEQFDFAFQPSIQREQLERLHELHL
jgi:DNA replication protein DnaC